MNLHGEKRTPVSSVGEDSGQSRGPAAMTHILNLRVSVKDKSETVFHMMGQGSQVISLIKESRTWMSFLVMKFRVRVYTSEATPVFFEWLDEASFRPWVLTFIPPRSLARCLKFSSSSVLNIVAFRTMLIISIQKRNHLTFLYVSPLAHWCTEWYITNLLPGSSLPLWPVESAGVIEQRCM